MKDKGFGFAVIRTVFEGADVNTFDKLRLNQERYGLAIPFGQDLPPLVNVIRPSWKTTVLAGRPGSPSSTPQATSSSPISRLDARRFLGALGADDADLSVA